MEFSPSYRMLTNGRAIKRPVMLGYIERIDVNPQYSQENTYDVGNKVMMNGRQYTALKASSSTNIHTPNEREYWSQDAEISYKIVWHKRSGTTYTFYFGGASGTDSTGLIVNKELLTHIVANDWADGSAADFAEALSPTSEAEW